ncbi:acyl-CoA thioesterase [Galbitalea sp. SE-J8]|uniref:acyl-CoA thioesterase n=1 Tax=Galbitalea sp. SE-J8 TaxID=3054952 RepID=UPI00259CB3CB|nr:acyl-CoA thioesterase [Galbitalea sp. SE-J8]MDM4763335.1 acyl-CoA thioesterase [Galbitalea sp. SE-J8]
MIFRTLYWLIRSRRGGRLGAHDVGRIRMRARLTDIDTLGHINNGNYLGLMDLGRVDLLIRAGLWRRMMRLRVYPVVASSTMTYRRSIDRGQAFTLETRIAGYDERAVYLEQQFVVDGEVWARGVVRGRFLRRGGGTVSTAELAELLGVDPGERVLPEWVARWAADVALPSTRQPAPADWGA